MINATETDRLSALENEVRILSAKVDEFIALANQIKDNIEPAFNSLKNSAIGKMLGV